VQPEKSSHHHIDLLEAIEKILRYTDGMDFEAFSADEKTQDAVLRNLTIIGEVAARISQAASAPMPDLPLDQMKGMRNIIVHEYFGVSLRVVWETVQADLPPLIPILKNLLEASNDSD